MNFSKKETHTIITPSENSFVEFHKAFEAKVSTFEKEHVFIDFLHTFKVDINELQQLAEIAITKKENGTSFVLICDTVEIDDFEDESLSIVPTLVEAEDILAMDEIERDLGF
jgi:hypothetical protein